MFPPSRSYFLKNFLFDGESIRQEKDRGKGKSRAEGKGRGLKKRVLSLIVLIVEATLIFEM
jgi:hypothetical protein